MAEYITRRGYKALQDELASLKVKRVETADSKLTAAQFGDETDSAEFESAERELYLVNKQITELERYLRDCHIFDGPANTDAVSFGTKVRVLDEDKDEEYTFNIVGTRESAYMNDPDEHVQYVSPNSPVGRALLGKEVDDEIKVKVPSGVRSLYVLSIDEIDLSD